MTSTWANARSLIFNLPYGDQGLLIPRKLLMENGSYSPIPIMEDVELALRFKGKLFCMPVVITTSSRKYRKNGWLRQGSKNIVRLLRFLLGADPNNLSDDYNQANLFSRRLIQQLCPFASPDLNCVSRSRQLNLFF